MVGRGAQEHRGYVHQGVAIDTSAGGWLSLHPLTATLGVLIAATNTNADIYGQTQQ